MKSNYQAKQLEVIRGIEEGFRKGQAVSTVVKPVLDYINDDRVCLTSVAFIPQNFERKIIEKIIRPLSQIDSAQYFYVSGSFHITITNIRTIENPPLFNNDDVEKVRKVFKKIIPKYKPFKFDVKRLFELPTSLAISAFSDETFGDLALELRSEIEKAGVPDNKTYANENIVIGNVTVSRFVDTPSASFQEKIEELKEVDIGTFEVNKISLITTNAACHPSKTKIIEEYSLNKLS